MPRDLWRWGHLYHHIPCCLLTWTHPSICPDTHQMLENFQLCQNTHCVPLYPLLSCPLVWTHLNTYLDTCPMLVYLSRCPSHPILSYACIWRCPWTLNQHQNMSRHWWGHMCLPIPPHPLIWMHHNMCPYTYWDIHPILSHAFLSCPFIWTYPNMYPGTHPVLGHIQTYWQDTHPVLMSGYLWTCIWTLIPCRAMSRYLLWHWLHLSYSTSCCSIPSCHLHIFKCASTLIQCWDISRPLVKPIPSSLMLLHPIFHTIGWCYHHLDIQTHIQTIIILWTPIRTHVQISGLIQTPIQTFSEG